MKEMVLHRVISLSSHLTFETTLENAIRLLHVYSNDWPYTGHLEGLYRISRLGVPTGCMSARKGGYVIPPPRWLMLCMPLTVVSLPKT